MFYDVLGLELEAAESEAKLQLSTARILTDVLAQWIRRSSSLLSPPPPANTIAALF